MKHLFIILGLITLFICCKNDGIKRKIKGVWILEKEINNIDFLDSIHYGFEYPLILDFRGGNEIIIKKFHYTKTFNFTDTTFYGNFITDSIITIDTINYIIQIINDNKIGLMEYSGDSSWLILRRPENVIINYKPEEINKILTSDIWTIEDSINYPFFNHFEYLTNGTVIYRYETSDTIDNLQLENWGVTYYEKYFFIYNYWDPLFGNGNWDQFCQITSIDSSSYSVFCGNTKKSFNFLVKKTADKREEFSKKLPGKWISHNSKQRSYGKLLIEWMFKNGYHALYEDDLVFEINDSIIKYQIKNFDTTYCRWRLSREAKILIMEYEFERLNVKGYLVEYADIIEFTDNKLNIILNDHTYSTGLKKPNTYFLNRLQEFERIK